MTPGEKHRSPPVSEPPADTAALFRDHAPLEVQSLKAPDALPFGPVNGRVCHRRVYPVRLNGALSPCRRAGLGTSVAVLPGHRLVAATSGADRRRSARAGMGRCWELARGDGHCWPMEVQ